MADHKPGPWWIDEDGDYLCICEGDVNEFGEREEVALLHCNRPSLRATQPANARLIASAPDLLAALKLCKQALKNYIDSGYDEEEDQEAYAAAMAALSKAEGRGA